MSETYPKINTLYLRDERNIIIPGSYSCDEFAYLAPLKWECTEKIDGTNIRVFVQAAEGTEDVSVTFGGRTDKAVIPANLLARLHEIFDGIGNEKWLEIFPCLKTGSSVIIFGEGYGSKIQGCGSRYIKDGANLILFDVKIDKWWLGRDDVVSIAYKLGLAAVPYLGLMTIKEAEEFVKKGFKSAISQDPDLDAEGLVLKTPSGLLFRNGSRIVTKIKTGDFRKHFAAYGNEKVEQKPNSAYKIQ